ncbi:uncharacterized protein LOC119295868 isoform X3 [Triticum dicoccoides]|uniref:uncharacterized protein LOC119295868 isoform X3 n=1 Tax=Triticum dicoccoides TaxID=85692 RepID=UPI00188E1660|nr:uncharacterized protein LOC119295868 isoform X3 [Triticum dicoccoides]
MADLRHHQGPQWSCLRVSFLRPLLLCPCPRHAMGLPTLALASRKGEEGRSNLPYTKQEEGGRGRRGARSSNLTEMAAPSSQGRLQIAGRNINVALIQNLVLGCNTHCPGQIRI